MKHISKLLLAIFLLSTIAQTVVAYNQSENCSCILLADTDTEDCIKKAIDIEFVIADIHSFSFSEYHLSTALRTQKPFEYDITRSIPSPPPDIS